MNNEQGDVTSTELRSSEGSPLDKAFVEHLKKFLILRVPGSVFEKPGWLRFV